MITWMQKHKKWLVVTIWISTIAFVGAGFVGWGSYDFSKDQGAIAKVGNRELGVADIQREYSSLYSQYSQMFGEQFNQELAKELKLEDMAFNRLLQKTLFLCFADEIGLDITSKEIAKSIIDVDAFKQNGKFNKDIYIKVLLQNRTNPIEYEASLKNDMLLQKVQNLFQQEIFKEEIENISPLLFVEDKIKLTIIDGNSIKIKPKDDKLKDFWEKNKNNYMSSTSYNIETYEIKIKDINYSNEDLNLYFEKNKDEFREIDGKIKKFDSALEDIKMVLNKKNTKKIALKTYLKLKKLEIKFSKKELIYENSNILNMENLNKIKDSKNGIILKPIFEKDRYIVVKKLSTNSPKPLAFEKVKSQITGDFILKMRKLELEKLAQKQLSNFKGKDIGFISRESIDSIKGLDQTQAGEFLQQLFSKTIKKDIIYLDSKAIIYEIVESRLKSYDKTKDEMVKNSIEGIKQDEILTNLLQSLENRYETISYMNK